MNERERELEERLITIEQMLKAYLLEAGKRMMTHSRRNYRVEHILDTMNTWRELDKTNRPVLAQLLQTVDNDTPF